jgi:subfamily B ATP-binding cassette protein MsbA
MYRIRVGLIACSAWIVLAFFVIPAMMLIQDGLRSLRQGRTTFVIAHRLSTIRSADQILVLEAGEIVERGTHAELLAHGGRYRQLYDKQYHFEHDRFVNPGEELPGEPKTPVEQH